MSAKNNKLRCVEWTAQQISKADRFVACLLIGRGSYDKREAETLEGARKHRKIMEEEYANMNFGRSVMIYAVTKGNELSIFVE